MPSAKARLGRRAEIKAAGELGKRGYRIIDSNYRCKLGEIDLIAMDGDTMVFVEVRSRTTTYFGPPSETVNFIKQQKIIRSARVYLMQKNKHDIPCRFDVVEVVFNDKDVQIEVIKNAFSADE